MNPFHSNLRLHLGDEIYVSYEDYDVRPSVSEQGNFVIMTVSSAVSPEASDIYISKSDTGETVYTITRQVENMTVAYTDEDGDGIFEVKRINDREFLKVYTLEDSKWSLDEGRTKCLKNVRWWSRP